MKIHATFVATLIAVVLAVWGAFVPQPPRALIGKVDRIVIDKSDRILMVYQADTIVRSYRMALGFAPIGDKLRQGDGRTPEGTFRINRRNAQSVFHLSLGLDYPHQSDIARAAEDGFNPGGDIFIHGQPAGLGGLQRIAADWTAGCIALTNAAMEELWKVSPIGTIVEIRP